MTSIHVRYSCANIFNFDETQLYPFFFLLNKISRFSFLADIYMFYKDLLYMIEIIYL